MQQQHKRTMSDTGNTDTTAVKVWSIYRSLYYSSFSFFVFHCHLVVFSLSVMLVVVVIVQRSRYRKNHGYVDVITTTTMPQQYSSVSI